MIYQKAYSLLNMLCRTCLVKIMIVALLKTRQQCFRNKLQRFALKRKYGIYHFTWVINSRLRYQSYNWFAESIAQKISKSFRSFPTFFHQHSMQTSLWRHNKLHWTASPSINNCVFSFSYFSYLYRKYLLSKKPL